MVPANRNRMSLYQDAKASLKSLIKQTAQVFLGFMIMLLVTGGNPPGFVVGLSFCLGVGFVAWSEKNRLQSSTKTTKRIEPEKPFKFADSLTTKRIGPEKPFKFADSLTTKEVSTQDSEINLYWVVGAVRRVRHKNLLSWLGYLTPLLGVGAIIFLQTLHLNQIKSRTNIDYRREEYSLKVMLDAQKRIPSFGFSNLLADWTFLKYVQYFGDVEARQKTGYSLVPEFFELIVESDPHFVEAFLNLATTNSLSAGRPDKTVALMEEVLKTVSPETSSLAGYIWLYKGIDEILFIGDLESAKHSYKMADKWLSLVGHDVTAQRARETVQFLETNPDGKEARIAAWVTILSNAPDSKTKQYAIDQIQALGGTTFGNQIIVYPSGKPIDIPNPIFEKFKIN